MSLRDRARRLLHLLHLRGRPDADFADEVRAHIDLETDRLVAEGMAPDEARAAAHRAFGNVGRVQERFYDARRLLWLDDVGRDLRLALRGLRRAPGFAAAALATLALGLGVNTAVFTLLYATAFRPLPVRDADRVVTVHQSLAGSFSRGVNGSPYMVSYPEYQEYRAAGPALAGLAAFAETTIPLGPAGDEHVRAQLVSCDYFRVLRVATALGRTFAPDECEREGGAPVAVVSDGFWRRALGGAPTAVGRSIVLAGRPFTVVAVAEAGFAGTTIDAAEVWVPLSMRGVIDEGRGARPEESPTLATRDFSWLALVGRLAPGATPARAKAELEAAARRANERLGDRTATVSVDRGAYLTGPEAREQGSIVAIGILAVGALVVLMACANVMNLLLARAAARRREIAVRLAIGASRGRLVRQLLVESLLLALAGGALGLLIANELPRVVLAAFPGFGTRIDLSLDPRIVLYALGLTTATALVFGLAPALQATRVGPSLVLGSGSSLASSMRGLRESKLRSRLVGVQVAGSLLLLVGAALAARGVVRARTANPGYATRDILVVSVDPAPGARAGAAAAGSASGRAASGDSAARAARRAADAAHARLVLEGAERRLAALPEVESVARTAALPLVARFTTLLSVDPAAGADAGVPVASNMVSASYFRTMGIPIVRGRAFADAEAAADPAPAVVSAATARLWGGRDPLGARFRSGGRVYYVAGIAADVRSASLAELDPAFVYAPLDSDEGGHVQLVARVRAPAGDPRAVAGALARVAAAVPSALRDVDPAARATSEPLEAALARLLRPFRVTALLISALGVLAALVAVVGVYGVASYTVTRRARELAVRIALGATPAGVVRLVVRQEGGVVLVGLAAGLLLAAGAARAIRGMLFGVSAHDPLSFAGTTALVGGAALLAMWLPARRVASREPAVVLREE